ncbi:cytochrome P450 82A1, partial [Nymphaea colorata]|uniref:cytochrome P450 82A1 n=1 Tax=Nymphaea colorata TaxID=210225 RepID=UPI00129DABD8
MEPIQLGGFDVPVGSTPFVNAWKIHRDPTLWTDPEEFKPERFLSSNNEMTSFGGQDFPSCHLGQEGEKLGPLFSLQLGQRRAIVVSSMDLAKECFTVNDRAFAGRPQLEGWKRLGYNRAMFVFSPYGPYFLELRKIVANKLLSSQQLRLVKHIQVDEVGSLVQRLYRSCSNLEPVEMNHHLTWLAMNIVLRVVAGKRYFDLGGEGKEFREALGEFNNLVGTFTLSDAIPWLGWLDLSGHLQAMKRVHQKMDEVASAWLAEHRRKESSGAGEESDLMDVLIKELKDGHLSENHQTDAIIKATAT